MGSTFAAAFYCLWCAALRSASWLVLAAACAFAAGQAQAVTITPAITLGGYFGCSLSARGEVQCWGSNFGGELGDGTTVARALPQPVSGLGSGVLNIAAGQYHACAVIASGAVKCWGENYHGLLSDGTTTDRYVVSPSLSKPLAVADAVTVTPQTDGAMILRYLSGLVGASITSGIGTTDTLRTDAAQVNSYLETIRPLLDIDGNGQFSALTDGLLIIRYMAGLRNEALLSGAVGVNATRDAAAIQAYLATLLP